MNTQTITKNESIRKPKNFFRFGENWSHYLDNCLNDTVIEYAIEATKKFCGEENIQGKTFVDIGCGSGLFSLVAHRLGAKKILSLDIDENSVECCRRLREAEGNPENWEITHGSILDESFVNSLGTYDFVYSWGVLHHTGNMWTAIDHAARLVKADGYMCIAIYNKSDGFNIYPDFRFGNSYMWLAEKKFYTSLPKFLQFFIDYLAMTALICFYLATFTNPFKQIKNHINFRGMSWKTDIIDWLGGYPYEFATVAEIFLFLQKKGFNLENLICNNGLLNNEFLLKKVK